MAQEGLYVYGWQFSVKRGPRNNRLYIWWRF